MIDPNAPAYPTQNGCKNDPGMTIRATMAMHIMAGHVGNSSSDIFQANGGTFDDIANDCVRLADALIAELNKTEVQS